jgi:hypothetical protein
MEDILSRLSQDWPVFSLLAILLIKAFQSQLAFLVPEAIRNYFTLAKDKQEHVQETEKSILEFERLKQLSQLSSLSFTEEQLTQLTAETQTQLNEANSFIRQLVNQKLDIVIELLTALRGVQSEIKDTQIFILDEMRK